MAFALLSQSKDYKSARKKSVPENTNCVTGVKANIKKKRNIEKIFKNII